MFSVDAEQAEGLYQTGRELFFPGAQRTTMSLSRLLQSRPETELRCMIEVYKLDPTGLRRKSELLEALEEALTDADYLLATLARLELSVREVFSWLVERGGRAGIQAVRTQFALDNEGLFTLLEMLEAYGLAFDTLAPEAPDLRLLFIPQALISRLQAAATGSISRQQELVPLSAPPALVDEGEPRLVGDLAVVVNAAFQMRVEYTQLGAIAKRCATRIQSLLRGRARPGALGGDLYLDTLFETAERLSLIQRVHPPFLLHSLRPYYEPAPGLRSWVRLTLVEQTQRLLSWWTTNATWQDVTGSDFRQWNPTGWTPLAARPLLISALQRCSPGTWYSIGDFLEFLWRTAPHAMHPGREQHAQGLRSSVPLRTQWLGCEGAVLRGMLASTIWELGLISLGKSKESREEMYGAFQLTGLGATVLQAVAPDGSAGHTGGDTLLLLPTGEALLLELDTIALYRLLPYVEVRQIDRAIRLAFTRSSITRAIDQGHPLEALLEYLEGEKLPIPQNVLYMLRDWAGGFAVAELQHVLLLSVPSEESARALMGAPRLRAWGLRQLSPTIVAAPAHAHLGELRRALEDEGFMVHLGREVLPYPVPFTPQQPGNEVVGQTAGLE